MKANFATVSKRPIEIKNGSVTVKIYEGTNRVQGNAYRQYTVVHYHGSQRVKRKFSDLKAARREAETVAAQMAKGENDVLRLTAADRTVYLQAQADLRPLNRPLNVVVSEYVSAAKKLPQGVTIGEAVDFFLKRIPTAMPSKTVREVADELLETKTKAGRGAFHLKDIRSRLGNFAEAFQMPIGQITGMMIERYLENMKVGGRTKWNHLRHINALFKFAIRRKYLPKDAQDEVAGIEKPEKDITEIEIFSPAEMNEMLSVAGKEIVPWLAMAGFAGLRMEELQRLDWRDVNLTERHIEVTAAKAKTASRRLAPVTDNLLAWLKPHAQKAGRISHYENMAKQLALLVKDVNALRQQRDEPLFEWKRNALRHSFISYRLAAIKNTAEVALEAGNSPQMIFQHYRQLVTEAEAKKWFSIMPEKLAGKRRSAQPCPTP